MTIDYKLKTKLIRDENNKKNSFLFPTNYSIGSNLSESLLLKACRQSFLSFWTIPNPCYQIGGEMCDAFISYDNNFILFSDKATQKEESSNKELYWPRFTKHIKKSEGQLLGAFNTIQNNAPIYFDSKCTELIQLDLSNPNVFLINVYRIENDEYKKNNPRLINKKIEKGDNTHPYCFANYLNTKKNIFIHSIIGQDLDLIFNKFTTTIDLIEYLKYREEFFLALNKETIITELEIIKKFESSNHIAIPTTDSYFIDYLIEDFIRSSFVADIPEENASQNKSILNCLSKLSRYDRNELAKKIFDTEYSINDYIFTYKKEEAHYLLGFFNVGELDLNQEEDNLKFFINIEETFINYINKNDLKGYIIGWGNIHVIQRELCQFLAEYKNL